MWNLALSGPNFLFRSLNKLGPLVAYQKTELSVPAHMGQDQSTPVSSQSINIQDHFTYANCEPRITLYALERKKEKVDALRASIKI